MAKKRRDSKSGRRLVPKSAKARITLEPNDAAPVYYVNFIEVANTVNDFTLLCSRLPAKISAAKREEALATGTLSIDSELQIVVPTSLVPGLIRALTVQKETYEKQHGVELKEIGGEEK